MKTILVRTLPIFLLTGCIMESNPEWYQLQSFCNSKGCSANVDKDLFLKYINQPYGEDLISLCEHTQGTGGAFSRTKCQSFLENKTYSVNDFAMAAHYANKDITDINYVNYRIVENIVNFKRGDITEKEWYERKPIEQKYGKKTCSHGGKYDRDNSSVDLSYFIIHLATGNNDGFNAPDKCITTTEYGLGLQVKQQIPQGTFVEGRKAGEGAFLIEYNKELSHLVPGQTLHGRFIGTGKAFTYTDTLRYEHKVSIIKFLGYK